MTVQVSATGFLTRFFAVIFVLLFFGFALLAIGAQPRGWNGFLATIMVLALEAVSAYWVWQALENPLFCKDKE